MTSARPLVASPDSFLPSSRSNSLRKHHRHSDDDDDDDDGYDSGTTTSSSSSEDDRNDGGDKTRSKVVVLVLFTLLCIAAVAVAYVWSKQRRGETLSPSTDTKPGTESSKPSDSRSASSSSPSRNEGDVDSTRSTSRSSASSPTTTTKSKNDDSPTSPPSSPSSTTTVPPSSSSSSSSSLVSQALVDVLLKTHNDFRTIHQVDPLEWNDTLTESSDRWVDNCVFEHSGGRLLEGGYGENLYAVSSPAFKEDTPVDGKAGVDAW
ncbi:hypothetical protein JCM3766R1_003504 [Sporobolomyces carnicolor]